MKNNPHKNLKPLTLLLAVFFAAAGCRQQSAQLPNAPEVEHGVLENGFSYFLQQNSTPKERAALYLAIKAGSVLEEDNEQGLAHFVEHMAFNGGKRFPPGQLVNYLQSIGMEFGPDLNAYTSFDETVYILNVPLNKENALTDALNAIRDWSGDLLFNEEEVAKERGVITEEWRGRRSANARVSDKEYPVILEGSRYAQRLPIGKLEIIENAPAQTIKDFYEKWYKPQHMALIAVGDFDKEALAAQIKAAFSDLENDGSTLPVYNYNGSASEKIRFSSIVDPELTNSWLTLYYRGKALGPINKEDELAVELTDNLISAMLNARLQAKSLEEHAPFFQAYSSSSDFVSNEAFFFLETVYKEGQGLQAYQELLTTVEQARRYGFSSSELDRAKRALLSVFEQSANEADKTENEALGQAYVLAYLNGSAYPNAKQKQQAAQKLLPGISLKQVRNRFKALAGAKEMITTVSAPDNAANTPDVALLRETFNSFNAKAVKPYQDIDDSGELYTEPKKKGKVENEQTLEENIVHWTLSNGAEIYYKKTDFKNDEILFSATAPGGLNLASEDDYFNAAFAVSLIGESGLGQWNKAALNAKLADSQLELAPFISESWHGFNGWAAPKELEKAFALMRLYKEQPRKDEAAFLRMREQAISAVKNSDKNPSAAFSKLINQTLYPNGGARFRRYETADLEQLDFEKTYSFFTDLFQDSGVMDYTFVGAIDEKELKSLTETWIGSLPTAPKRNSQPSMAPMPQKKAEAQIKTGIENQAELYFAYVTNYAYSPQDIFLADALGMVFDMRMIDVVREQMGAAYSPYVSFSRRGFTNRCALAVYLTLDPQRINEIFSVIDDEWRSLQSGGFDDSYFEKAREILRENTKTARQNNSYWLENVNTALRAGLKADAMFVGAEERIKAINKAGVSSYAAKLTGGSTVRVSRLPAL